MLLPLTSVPQLGQVDSDIFTLRYFGSCTACTFCRDACCQHGCDVNVGERDRILARKEALRPFVFVPPEQWFSAEVHEDPEYPTGQFVRANTFEGGCVFLNRKIRGCSLHAFAVAQRSDYHQLKPMVCWMFPVCWDQRILRPNIDVEEGLICAGAGITLYDGAREELRVVFGDALIAELDGLCGSTQLPRASLG